MVPTTSRRHKLRSHNGSNWDFVWVADRDGLTMIRLTDSQTTYMTYCKNYSVRISGLTEELEHKKIAQIGNEMSHNDPIHQDINRLCGEIDGGSVVLIVKRKSKKRDSVIGR
jgi:hypothetical protein